MVGFNTHSKHRGHHANAAITILIIIRLCVRPPLFASHIHSFFLLYWNGTNLYYHQSATMITLHDDSNSKPPVSSLVLILNSLIFVAYHCSSLYPPIRWLAFPSLTSHLGLVQSKYKTVSPSPISLYMFLFFYHLVDIT
jgi:hypothetical protein